MRSEKQIRSLVKGFAKSGMTRGAYCAKHGIAVTTLDYWRRTQRQRKPRLVRVAIQGARTAGSFTLVLANGRRIESSWSFAEADLRRLISAAEG